ncbi:MULTISPECIES: cyclopropane-fatty-acyl-phospholipid synthase family protein [unclassified Acidisoma]|jgi:cyclopropane-fatty-acyl-phospholipid synthase|uniref:SAM-dependent methyltransferase n=1 Tax=unclassified Acidisoma TaxID=2634065 RepID=UPI00131A65D6|nr:MULTISPECIES: cyclopropane-fatty-acyl-phospholipid synthase family protein [unclassified Acidisoma]
MRQMLDRLLTRLIRQGGLSVIWPNGERSSYGPDKNSPVTIKIAHDRMVRQFVLHPGLAIGEAYMDGSLAPVDCNIYQVLEVLLSNLQAAGIAAVPTLKGRILAGTMVRRLRQINSTVRARRNVAHHYDLNGRLYSLFLDRDRQYSCAYFRTGTETLEEAQTAKKHHIAAKLKLDRPGLTVLDIGCGWGGMALTLARDYGARVTGITLSTEQLNEARARAEAEGLSDRVKFELLDYRAVRETYDRVVSVGMFEHVGVNHYRTFFNVLKRVLKPDGVALLHTIGRSDGPGTTNSWIAKYIFPGGYSPALSETMLPIEKSGLLVTDVEILRLHYAETLRHWRRRFAANRDAISTLYDERFCRMFEFYLAGSELAFRYQEHVNFQIQITREQTAAPLTRDYITEVERERLRAHEPAMSD